MLLQNDELALKLQLSERFLWVQGSFWSIGLSPTTNETELAKGKAVLELIKKSGGSNILNSHSGHSLEKAGLSVQEDLCLMNRTSEGWILKAASLCFPSRWQLREKIGKNMSHIHGPVEGYEEHLSKRVNNFFDRIGNEPVWRRNWFIHPDNSLYQPQRPLNGDPIIEFSEIGESFLFEVKDKHSNSWRYRGGFCSQYAFKELRLKIYYSHVKRNFKNGSLKPLNLIMTIRDLLLSKWRKFKRH